MSITTRRLPNRTRDREQGEPYLTGGSFATVCILESNLDVRYAVFLNILYTVFLNIRYNVFLNFSDAEPPVALCLLRHSTASPVLTDSNDDNHHQQQHQQHQHQHQHYHKHYQQMNSCTGEILSTPTLRTLTCLPPMRSPPGPPGHCHQHEGH